MVCRGEGTTGTPEGGSGGWGACFCPQAGPDRVPPSRPQLTFVDFLMFDVLEQNRIFEPKCLEPFKNLKDFMDRFGVSWATPDLTLPTLGEGPPALEGTQGWGVPWWDGSLTLPLPPQALEKVAAYMKSSRFLKMPINNKMAKWGNKKE